MYVHFNLQLNSIQLCIIISNDWIRPGMNDKRKLNWLLQWFYFEFSQWMCSVVTHSHIGILNNALFSSLQTPLSAFQMSQKSLYCSERYFTSGQYESCLHYIQYVILLETVSKVAWVFWPKCFWKCDVKRETYKSTSKRFSERMSCELLAIFPKKFAHIWLFSLKKVISS